MNMIRDLIAKWIDAISKEQLAEFAAGFCLLLAIGGCVMIWEAAKDYLFPDAWPVDPKRKARNLFEFSKVLAGSVVGIAIALSFADYFWSMAGN